MITKEQRVIQARRKMEFFRERLQTMITMRYQGWDIEAVSETYQKCLRELLREVGLL